MMLFHPSKFQFNQHTPSNVCYLLASAKILIVLGVLCLTFSVHANVQSQLDKLFGSMTNTTQPGVFETQRRGVIAGGSLVTRNRIMNENLVSMVPPSIQAGCGGIDMFAGSLSFINAEQFVQLLRSVAANAKGYAFQLALSAMCEKCSQHIETLQKKIQQLNEYFGNSCQLAQGIVNDSLSAFGMKGQTDASMLGTLKGVGDVFTSWSSSTGKNPYENVNEVAKQDVKTTIQGNLVWRALKKHRVANWFTAGDDNLLEAIMSVTGSIIVGELKEDKNKQGQSPEFTKLPPNKLTIEDLLLGGQVSLYRCDTQDEDGCLKPTLVNSSLNGLAKQVETLLLGDAQAPGIIFKFARNDGVISDREQAFLSSAPVHIGTMIRTLSALSESGARSFAERAAPFIALEMTRSMIEEMLSAARNSALIDDHAYSKLLAEDLVQVRHHISLEHAALQRRYGSEQTLVEHYNQLLQLIQHQKYYSVTLGLRD